MTQLTPEEKQQFSHHLRRDGLLPTTTHHTLDHFEGPPIPHQHQSDSSPITINEVIDGNNLTQHETIEGSCSLTGVQRMTFGPSDEQELATIEALRRQLAHLTDRRRMRHKHSAAAAPSSTKSSRGAGRRKSKSSSLRQHQNQPQPQPPFQYPQFVYASPQNGSVEGFSPAYFGVYPFPSSGSHIAPAAAMLPHSPLSSSESPPHDKSTDDQSPAPNPSQYPFPTPMFAWQPCYMVNSSSPQPPSAQNNEQQQSAQVPQPVMVIPFPSPQPMSPPVSPQTSSNP